MLMCVVMLVSMLPYGNVWAEPGEGGNSTSNNSSSQNSSSQNSSSQNNSQSQNQSNKDDNDGGDGDGGGNGGGDEVPTVSGDEVSGNSVSQNEPDEREEDISTADGLYFVAFYAHNKRIGEVIYTPKDSVISCNAVPDDPAGSFVGWYEFNVAKDKDNKVTITDTGIKWDMTIPIKGNLRLDARFSDMTIDEDAAMNSILSLDVLENNSTLWLVKGQKVSSNEIISTDNKRVVKLLASKKTAQAKRLGSAKLTLASGKTINVEVTTPKLLKKQEKIYVGDTLDIVWDTDPNWAHVKNVAWKSSNVNIVRVNAGKAYAVGKGTATVYAYIGGQKYKTKITVKDKAIENIILPVNININKNRTIRIKGVKAKKAKWEIVEPDKQSLITLTKSGKVKAGESVGNATVKCTAEDGKVYYRRVYIENPAPSTGASITYTKKKYRLIMDKGESVLIQFDKGNLYQNVLWTTSFPARVYVDETGLVVARKAHSSATLSAKINGKSVKIYVTVRESDKERTNVDKPAVCLDLRYADPPVIPDDGLDDTLAINLAIQRFRGQDAEENDHTLYLGPGTYNITVGGNGNPQHNNDAIHFDYDNSNITFVMDVNAKLVVSANKLREYAVIKIGGGQDNTKAYAQDITIKGGQICGERAIHKGSGEEGHGIVCGSYCSNITIDNMVIKDNNGDGVYIGGSVGYTDKINILNCVIKNNRRSNISMVWGSNITVDGCEITNANGSAPMAGINIEPNLRGGTYNTDVTHVTITNSTINAAKKNYEGPTDKSYYFAFLVHDLDSTGYAGKNTADDIYIDKCNFYGVFYNGSGSNMKIRNTKIDGDFYDKRNADLDSTVTITGKH